MLIVNRNLCIGCGKCLQVCPNQAIAIVDAKAKINQGLCSECYRCVEVCPREAIGDKILTNSEEIRKSLEDVKGRLNSLKRKVSLVEKTKNDNLYRQR